MQLSISLRILTILLLMNMYPITSFHHVLSRNPPKTSPAEATSLQEPRKKPYTNMKLLTANFVTCAVKTCKSSPLSFPLHFRDAELEQRELDYNPIFLANILPRLDWDAIKVVAAEVCSLV